MTMRLRAACRLRGGGAGASKSMRKGKTSPPTFESADTNRDGVIDRAEFQVPSRYPHPNPDPTHSR